MIVILGPLLIIVLAGLAFNNMSSYVVKVGVYSIPTRRFAVKQPVYSYISDRTSELSRKQFYQFMKSKRQIKPKKSIEQVWKSDEIKIEDLID